MIPEIVAPDKHSIVVIGWHIWGKGESLKEAIKQARKVGSIQQGNYTAYIVPEDSGVDEMGRYESHRDCEMCRQIVHISLEAQARIVAKRNRL